VDNEKQQMKKKIHFISFLWLIFKWNEIIIVLPLSWTQWITRIGTKPRTQQGEKNHKKCKPMSDPRLKTQRWKVKTRYMLEDDSNRTLFWSFMKTKVMTIKSIQNWCWIYWS
jgi:hypothetical protein